MRRSASLLLAGGLALSLGLAACTSSPDPATTSPSATPSPTSPTPTSPAPSASPTRTSPPPASSAPAPPALSVTPQLAALQPLAQDWYAGRPVRTEPTVERALGDARTGATPASGTIKGGIGQWDGTPIAVLVHDQDVTLVVKKPQGWTVVGGWWPSFGIRQTLPEGTRSVLLIGSDARPGQPVDRSRADALQLVTSTAGGRGSVVGIARDSWLPVAGHGRSKINAAMVYGGPELLVESLSAATRVEIEGYLLTSFTQFEALVEAGGGLPIVLDEAVKGSTWANFPAGKQRLGGTKALSLARERKALRTGDFGRSAHQGDLVIGGLRVARSFGPARLPELISLLDANVASDLTADEALNVFARSLRAEPDTVDRAVTTGTTPMRSGQSVVEWDAQAIALFKDLAADGMLERD